ADAAIGVAAAFQRAPLRVEPLELVPQVREGARGRQWIPVPQRLGDAELPLDVVSEVRQRVTLALPGLVIDILVPSGEGDRLERNGVDLVDVVDRELDDGTDLSVVDGVHDRDDERTVDARALQVLESPL